MNVNVIVLLEVYCMFGFAVGKVEFGRIDSKNLIVAKIDLKIK
jgi:hypothetical protein